MNTLTTKKLASYSGLVSAILLSDHAAEGQIIYTNPPDIHLSGPGAHHMIDLNNDGEVDFRILIFDSYTNTKGLAVVLSRNSSYNDFVEALMYSDCQGAFFYGYGVLPLKSGSPIPVVGQIVKDDILWYAVQYGEVLNWDYYGPTCHRWAGDHNRFVGLRLHAGINHDFYGWMRLSISPSGAKVIVHDWACNTIPNDPIYAGQTAKLSEELTDVRSDLSIYYGKQLFVDNNKDNRFLEISFFSADGRFINLIQDDSESVTVELPQLVSGVYSQSEMQCWNGQ